MDVLPTNHHSYPLRRTQSAKQSSVSNFASFVLSAMFTCHICFNWNKLPTVFLFFISICFYCFVDFFVCVSLVKELPLTWMILYRPIASGLYANRRSLHRRRIGSWGAQLAFVWGLKVNFSPFQKHILLTYLLCLCFPFSNCITQSPNKHARTPSTCGLTITSVIISADRLNHNAFVQLSVLLSTIKSVWSIKSFFQRIIVYLKLWSHCLSTPGWRVVHVWE